MNKYQFFFLTLLLGCFLCGCSENINNIYIVEENGNPDNDSINTGTSNKTESRVLFHASVESVNSTKSMSAMNPNEIASIYSYQGNPSDLSVPYKSVDYKTMNPGLLSPIKSDTMNLPHGAYSFYSISTNSDVMPPKFVNGHSDPLLNGIDYLWWRTVNFEVKAPLVIVPVFFTHSASQVVIKLSAGKGITLNELVKAEIYPSASGATMDESTGIILQTDRFDNQLVTMGKKDLISQYTLLPVKSDKPMGAYFTVRVNSELLSRIYKVNIPLPASGLEGGKSYLFEAIIEAGMIEFKQVSVIDWVVVDQTGSPLYPSQI